MYNQWQHCLQCTSSRVTSEELLSCHTDNITRLTLEEITTIEPITALLTSSGSTLLEQQQTILSFTAFCLAEGCLLLAYCTLSKCPHLRVHIHSFLTHWEARRTCRLHNVESHQRYVISVKSYAGRQGRPPCLCPLVKLSPEPFFWGASLCND